MKMPTKNVMMLVLILSLPSSSLAVAIEMGAFGLVLGVTDLETSEGPIDVTFTSGTTYLEEYTAGLDVMTHEYAFEIVSLLTGLFNNEAIVPNQLTGDTVAILLLPFSHNEVGGTFSRVATEYPGVLGGWFGDMDGFLADSTTVEGTRRWIRIVQDAPVEVSEPMTTFFLGLAIFGAMRRFRNVGLAKEE